MTPLTKEAVERHIERFGPQKPTPEGYHPSLNSDTIEMLRGLLAQVEELEAALDSEHASVGSNIWRFWRDQALDIARSKDDAEKAARLQGLNEASIELRNRYEYQAARYVEALKGETTND